MVKLGNIVSEFVGKHFFFLVSKFGIDRKDNASASMFSSLPVQGLKPNCSQSSTIIRSCVIF